MQLTRNTCLTDDTPFGFWLPDADRRGIRLRVQATGNVFDARSVVDFRELSPHKFIPPLEAEGLLRELLTWQGQGNLYAVNGPFLRLSTHEEDFEPAGPIRSLAQWEKFWGATEANSIEGRVRYEGDNLLTQLRTAPQKLTPDDFRLRLDSAGDRAGPDGKNLGADIDVVGPGAAYERWKKTPEYQQWLKDIVVRK